MRTKELPMVEIKELEMLSEVDKDIYYYEGEKFLKEFLAPQKEFVSWELLKSDDNKWVEITHWLGIKNGKNAIKKQQNDESYKNMLKNLQLKIVSQKIYRTKMGWSTGLPKL